MMYLFYFMLVSYVLSFIICLKFIKSWIDEEDLQLSERRIVIFIAICLFLMIPVVLSIGPIYLLITFLWDKINEKLDRSLEIELRR